MAALSSSNITLLESAGDGERTCLFRVRNVDTGDTVDLTPWFTEIKVGTFIPSGVLNSVGVVGGTVAAASLTLAAMADDTIWLLVVGQHAV